MTKTLTLSRGTQIDTELCVANIGHSKYDLVLIAAARAREISRKHKQDGETSQVNACVSALFDVQNKLVGKEYLRKV